MARLTSDPENCSLSREESSTSPGRLESAKSCLLRVLEQSTRVMPVAQRQPLTESGSKWPPNTAGSPLLGGAAQRADRKSTRLNSSHRCISYAVFCLKKKTI